MNVAKTLTFVWRYLLHKEEGKMFLGIKERGKLLLVLLFSATSLLCACGGGEGEERVLP